MKYPAPIYADSLRFVEWLLGHFDERPTHSARSLCDGALQFVASIAAALREDWPRDRLEEADYRLMRLRVELRLAGRRSILTDAQLIHGLECADVLGRQLGGWIRSLEPA